MWLHLAISLAFQFPDKITDKTVIQSVPKFCFPEGSAVEKEVETEKTESFSFVSTLGDGSKRFGYCRRFFKPNKPPECYCLLSYAYVVSLRREKREKRKGAENEAWFFHFWNFELSISKIELIDGFFVIFVFETQNIDFWPSFFTTHWLWNWWTFLDHLSASFPRSWISWNWNSWKAIRAFTSFCIPF